MVCRLFLFLLLSCLIVISHDSRATNYDSLSLKAPIQENDLQENLPSQIDLSIIPNFPRFGISNTTIPLNTSLKLVVDNYIDVKTAMIGDYFKAHILEDFYIQTDPPQLILPKGSWVRGRISFLKRPNFFIKTGRIGLHLDQLVTPFGGALVLDAELDVQKGILTENGLLRPSVIKPADTQILSSSTLTIPISNVGASLIDKLLAGKLYALFFQNDTTVLNKGQELQIVLQKNVQLTKN